ncbi:MAG: hypothetical protein HY738_20895 [Bacteroidia bacterium]|nr:hypothetical protein [Bacteroidia bacterium]
MKKILLYILLSQAVHCAYAQMFSNIRTLELTSLADTIQIDTLSIIPGSISILDSAGVSYSDSLFIIDYAKSHIIPVSKAISKPVKITYRVFPFNLYKEYFHKDYLKISIYNKERQKPYHPVSDYAKFFERDELDKRGSISRGFTFGNAQDLTVSSNLNLQLSGKISDNLNVMAAITDNNIPLQPDGNSQQIQEFDKVFIQLYNNRIKLIAGDIEITKPAGQFMCLNKKAQGGWFTTSAPVSRNKSKKLNITGSGAIAKGKYCRYLFNGQEGNQGPYKLKGANNEIFIIILAGSEKVYIDGHLLQRGQENDYVIDYNTAELTFTPHQPVTKDKRIIVEFEYSERNYARFMVFNSNEFITDKSKFWFNIYSEQDSKNQPINQQLTDEQKHKLALIGDSLQLAVVQNINDTTFSNDLILYRMTDTLLSDSTYFDSIFIYSTDSGNAHYKLGFSYMGKNHGNYEPVTASANGRVYKWLPPVNNVLQGSYEPVILLVTPKKKQMLAAGGNIRLTRTTSFDFETGLTNNDLNTFSPYNRNDDVGYALKFGVMQSIPVKDTAFRIAAGIKGQHIAQYFDPVERFRSPEFERDWNLSGISRNSTEQLLNMNIDISHLKIGKLRYDADYMNRASGFHAIKNGINLKGDYRGISLLFSGSLLNSYDTSHTTTFLRHKASLSKNFSFLTAGIKEEQEDNRWRLINSDSLLQNSNSFTLWEIFINNSDTAKRKLTASYSNRKDFLPGNNTLKYSSLGQNINAGLQLLKNSNHTLQTTFNYRMLTIKDTALSDNKPENTVTGRIEHEIKIVRGLISVASFYEIGSGLELAKEFVYVMVTEGQGVYEWIDYNDNNIKELNEFEIANLQHKACYVRVFIPSENYLKIYATQFNQSFNIRADRLWGSKKGIRKLIARFSDQLAYRISRKNTEDALLKGANPFSLLVSDSNLVSLGSSFRNTLSFNRNSPVAGIDYIYSDNINKILLINGVDTRIHEFHGSRLRWNIIKCLTLINNFNRGIKSYQSEYFTTNNYKINYYSDETNINFQPGQNYRIGLIYTYTGKNNILGSERAFQHQLGTEFRYNSSALATISLRIDYIKIAYNGSGNTPVSYEMLQSLQPGNNSVWTLMVLKNLTNSLEINLNYTGRISQGASAVHTGGIQLRATF